MKPRILLIGQTPPPYHGSNIMAKTMLETLYKNEHDVLFINKAFSKTIKSIGRIDFRKLARIPILTIQVVFACLNKKPILCIYFIAYGKIAFLFDAFIILIIRKLKIPYVLRFGAKGFRDLVSENRFWKVLVSNTLANASAGFAQAEILKKDVNMYIRENNIYLIPNSVNDNYKKIEPLRERQTIRLLFLSNLIPSKGPLEFLKASKIILEKKGNIECIMAGADSSPQFSDDLREYVELNGLKNKIKFTGGVYGDKKNCLLSSSDILIFPTYYENEAFPTVIIEAMSMGLAIITSREGAIGEIIKDGDTGYLINAKDPEEIAEKTIKLIDNPQLLKKMKTQSRNSFEENYNLTAYSKNLENAIQTILKKANM